MHGDACLMLLRYKCNTAMLMSSPSHTASRIQIANSGYYDTCIPYNAAARNASRIKRHGRARALVNQKNRKDLPERASFYFAACDFVALLAGFFFLPHDLLQYGIRQQAGRLINTSVHAEQHRGRNMRILPSVSSSNIISVIQI